MTGNPSIPPWVRCQILDNIGEQLDRFAADGCLAVAETSVDGPLGPFTVFIVPERIAVMIREMCDSDNRLLPKETGTPIKIRKQ